MLSKFFSLFFTGLLGFFLYDGIMSGDVVSENHWMMNTVLVVIFVVMSFGMAFNSSNYVSFGCNVVIAFIFMAFGILSISVVIPMIIMIMAFFCSLVDDSARSEGY